MTLIYLIFFKFSPSYESSGDISISPSNFIPAAFIQLAWRLWVIILPISGESFPAPSAFLIGENSSSQLTLSTPNFPSISLKKLCIKSSSLYPLFASGLIVFYYSSEYSGNFLIATWYNEFIKSHFSLKTMSHKVSTLRRKLRILPSL